MDTQPDEGDTQQARPPSFVPKHGRGLLAPAIPFSSTNQPVRVKRRRNASFRHLFRQYFARKYPELVEILTVPARNTRSWRPWWQWRHEKARKVLGSASLADREAVWLLLSKRSAAPADPYCAHCRAQLDGTELPVITGPYRPGWVHERCFLPAWRKLVHEARHELADLIERR